VIRGKFTPRGEAYFEIEYHVAHRMPAKEREKTLAAGMARAETHYADLGFVEGKEWLGGVEGLKDTAGETDLAEYREE